MATPYALKKLERTAHHEAGHAVAACLFNIPILTVTVVPGPPDSSGGRTLGGIDLGVRIPTWANPFQKAFDRRRGRQYIAQNIQMTLAGMLAETLYTGCWQQATGQFSDEDENIAFHVGRPLHRTPKATRDWVNRLRFQMLETLRAPQVWAAVDTVAQELVRSKTLDGPGVHTLVRNARKRYIRGLKA